MKIGNEPACGWRTRERVWTLREDEPLTVRLGGKLSNDETTTLQKTALQSAQAKRNQDSTEEEKDDANRAKGQGVGCIWGCIWLWIKITDRNANLFVRD